MHKLDLESSWESEQLDWYESETLQMGTLSCFQHGGTFNYVGHSIGYNLQKLKVGYLDIWT